MSRWIDDALQAYTDASSLWAKQLKGGFMTDQSFLVMDPLVNEIKGRWPGLSGKRGSFEIHVVRQYLWSYAAERIEEVEKDLYQPM